jgi:hypothetical protein
MPRARKEVLEGWAAVSTSELLFRHDPVGINFEVNTDEYEPKAGTILPRLHACNP